MTNVSLPGGGGSPLFRLRAEEHQNTEPSREKLRVLIIAGLKLIGIY